MTGIKGIAGQNPVGRNQKMKELELYIHIPFCVHKCSYCDFLSAPAGRQVQNAYMETLLKEIHTKTVQRYAGKAVENAETVTSIFIGGGTPSVVEASWIEKLLAVLRAGYKLADSVEVSMEVNPGTVTRQALAIYKKAGINRLSIGCQSMQDKELKRLGRIHTAEQFQECYRWAREAGFDNINVDLMSALPGQTMKDWEENLLQVLALEPEHVSAYSLILEENTPFYDLWQKGALEETEEKLERAMYWRTDELLSAAGYVHYEISNYARPGFLCRHNCGYWTRTDYLGFGLGAASLDDHVRYKNTEDLDRYLQSGGMEYQEKQPLSGQDEMEETMFLGLRMLQGVDLQKFADTFGVAAEAVYGTVLEEGRQEGLLTDEAGTGQNPLTDETGVGQNSLTSEADMGRKLLPGEGARLRLTPRGIDVSNYVMAKFLF